jgi:hypothetical protein
MNDGEGLTQVATGIGVARGLFGIWADLKALRLRSRIMSIFQRKSSKPLVKGRAKSKRSRPKRRTTRKRGSL